MSAAQVILRAEQVALFVAGAVAYLVMGGNRLDRSLGYGLKLPSDFRYTHLGRIGR